ncbi:MAG: hemolysin family protein, partial [Limisphaerales bacterium]
EKLAEPLREIPWLAPYANAASIGIVVVSITYLSLIIGELVPKRIGLGNPEGIARIMAGPMNFVSALARPVVTFLGFSTDFVLRILRLKPKVEEEVSEDEVKMLMQEGMRAGIFHAAEPKMVESVLSLDRLPVGSIMTPRPKIIFLNKDDPHEALWHKIVVSAHSSFPVYEGDRDHVVGVVSVKAIYANLAAGAGTNLGDLMVPPLFVPEMQSVTRLLETFKKSGQHVALVVDEFGTIAGLVTLVDVLEAIVGDIPTPGTRLKPELKQRVDGSWLVDGGFDVQELDEILKIGLPQRANKGYETIAGFIFTKFGHVPVEGETLVWNDYLFEVIDMDRHRIDKILITKKQKSEKNP